MLWTQESWYPPCLTEKGDQVLSPAAERGQVACLFPDGKGPLSVKAGERAPVRAACQGTPLGVWGAALSSLPPRHTGEQAGPGRGSPWAK